MEGVVKARKIRSRKSRTSPGTERYDPSVPSMTRAASGSNAYPLSGDGFGYQQRAAEYGMSVSEQAAAVSAALAQYNMATYGNVQPPSVEPSPSSPSYYQPPTKSSRWLKSSGAWAARRKELTRWAMPFARWRLDGKRDKHLGPWLADLEAKTASNPLSADRRDVLLGLDPDFFGNTLATLRAENNSSAGLP